MPRLPGEDCLTSNLDEPNHVELAGEIRLSAREAFCGIFEVPDSAIAGTIGH